MSKVGKEHRQAIRMTGRMLFSHRRISPANYALLEADFKRGVPLRDRAEMASLQVFVGAQGALVRLRERDPDLGEFLQNLDAKINLLLQKVAKEPSPFDSMEMQQVSISGTGVGFAAKEAIAANERLEFHLILLPNQFHIYCLGEVVHCQTVAEPSDGHGFRVAARFTLIMEEDRERLIQYNFRLQSQALKNRRLEQDRPR